MAKLKSRRYKGGEKTTTQSTIPDWAVPYLQNAGTNAEAQYAAGNLDNVAGTNANLDRAFGSGGMIADQATRNIARLDSANAHLDSVATSGGYDTKAMKDAAILQAGQQTAKLSTEQGARGTLGSARQHVQQGAQNAATAAEFSRIDAAENQRMIDNKIKASAGLSQNAAAAQGIADSSAKTITNLGTTQRGIEQEQGDAQWQALQRYASTIYGNPARQQTVASGGGK